MAQPYPLPISGEISYDRRMLLGKSPVFKVYKGNYKGEPVAVKRSKVEFAFRKFNREMELLPKLNHENVVKILTVEQDYDFR